VFDGAYTNLHAALEAAGDARPVTEVLAALGIREYATPRELQRKPMLRNLLGLGLALAVAGS
jgi:hypothetical protein